MSTFAAIYYDGLTSQGREATVELAPEHLLIRLPGPDGEEQREWPVSGIERNELNEAHKALLRFGQFPQQTLEVDQPGFLPAIRSHYPQAAAFRSKYHFLRSKGTLGLVAASVLLVALVLGLYIYAVPAVAEGAAVALPRSLEHSLGQRMYDKLTSAEAETDSADTRSRDMQRFFNQLRLPDQEQPVRVTVVDSRQVNAFAVPGGFIIICAPILDELENETQLAALLAHEYAHLQKRHSLRALFRNLSGYLLLSSLFTDVNGMAAILIENAEKLHSLQFNRDLEQEADLLGLEIMRQNKIDPQGMVQLFQNLKKMAPTGVPEFVSTHPVFDSRISYLKKAIRKQPSEVEPHDSLQYYWQQLKRPLPAPEHEE